jgi:hypothetical protein
MVFENDERYGTHTTYGNVEVVTRLDANEIQGTTNVRESVITYHCFKDEVGLGIGTRDITIYFYDAYQILYPPMRKTNDNNKKRNCASRP